MNVGFAKGNGWRTMSDQVRLRVLAALDSGEERNRCGRGMDAFSWSFHAALAARACWIPLGVRSASGPSL